MEKKLIPVFAVALLAILAYQVFYYAPRMREFQAYQQEQMLREQATRDSLAALQPASPPPREPADTTVSVAPEQTALVANPVDAGGLPLVEPGSERLVTVETPLYRITMSSAGGEVISVELLEYETEKEPVQLIAWTPDSLQAFGGIALRSDQREVPLSRVRFDAFRGGGSRSPLPDGATIHVDPSGGEQTLVFRAEGEDGRQLERSYTFRPDTYLVRATVRFPTKAFAGVGDVEWAFGPGMRATEKNEREDHDAMRATLLLGEERHQRKRGDFVEDYSGTVQWAALQTKYFTTILLPETPTPGEARMKGRKAVSYMSLSVALPVAERGGRSEQAVELYFGPLDYNILKALGRGLDKNIAVGFDHVKIFKPVSVAILWSMMMLYKVIPNYGIVIIILSVFTKVLFYRLTHKSFKSMRDMQKLQPRLQAIKEKYKDDRQKMSQETMRVYKESGVNPLGGCLPMLLQMPVFIALFNVLRNTIEVRRAPFMLWMNDLSQQDVLFNLPISLPLIGSAVSVLPILMGGSMLLQSKIGGSITGQSSTGQPPGMTYILPIVFTVLFYKMPSGLVLYWIVNTVLSIGQQWYINKGADDTSADDKAKVPETPAAEPPAKPAGSGKPRKGRRQSRAKMKKG